MLYEETDGRHRPQDERPDGVKMWPERIRGSLTPLTDGLRLILLAEHRRRHPAAAVVVELAKLRRRPPAPHRKNAAKVRSRGPADSPTPGTIRELAEKLICAVAYRDPDNQAIGHDYETIRAKIIEIFPTVTKRGMHFGKKTKMPITELHNMSVWLRQRGIAVPFHIRSKGRVRGRLAVIEPLDSFNERATP